MSPAKLRASLLPLSLALSSVLCCSLAGATLLGGPHRAMMVRFIIDFEDSLTRETVMAYRVQLAGILFTGKHARAKLRFHHLPRARHRKARVAALAALSAREQGKETAFVLALLAGNALDESAIAAAAKRAGLALPKFAADRASTAVARRMDLERQALVALGVRATPTVIINGRGLAGLPPRRALAAAVRASWDEARICLERMGAHACELEGARRHAGAAADAFEALVNGTALDRQAAPARPIGRLGPRFKVSIAKWDVRTGRRTADVTAVIFLDPTDARQRAALARLWRIARGQLDRVVVKILPRTRFGDAASGALRTSLALTAIGARADRSSRGATVRAIASGKPWPTLLPALAASVGLAAGALDTALAAPETTVALDHTMRLATRVDARPGSIYINGRQWLGRPDDDGLDQAIELARGEAWGVRRGGVPAKQLYAALIARGRVRSEAEADLDDEEDLGDLGAIPDLGTAAQSPANAVDVYLFVDFRSLASRAAYHILRGQRSHPKHAIRLHMASMASSAEPAVTASGAAFAAAYLHGRGIACATRLFSLADPNDWRLLRRMWKSLGLARQLLQPAVTDPRTKAASAAVARLIKVFEMDTDPVIYIGSRRYVGPIDETRIERALDFSARKLRKAAKGPAEGPAEESE